MAHCTQSLSDLSIANVTVEHPDLPGKKTKKRSKRSSKTYKHPIPSRNELIDFLTKAGRPLKVKAIIDGFDLKGQRMRTLLEERLEAMHRAGQIIENRRREYCLTAKLDLTTGTVSGHRDGFGFVVRDDREADDIYLSAREMRSLFDGDRVVVKVIGTDRRGKPEGRQSSKTPRHGCGNPCQGRCAA